MRQRKILLNFILKNDISDPLRSELWLRGSGAKTLLNSPENFDYYRRLALIESSDMDMKINEQLQPNDSLKSSNLPSTWHTNVLKKQLNVFICGVFSAKIYFINSLLIKLL